MSSDQNDTYECITLETGPSPDAAIIWLHGLGADGNDFVPIVQQLQLPENLAIRFIFPHAPVRPISLNQGYAMRGWFDLYELSLDAREDASGIRDAGNRIIQLYQQQQAAGIASNRIILAGFSQGGALALFAGLRYPEKPGGILALSTYLCLKETLSEEKSLFASDIPVFMAHGLQDEVLPYEFGAKSADLMRNEGVHVEWHDYQMGHSLCMEEILDIRNWIIRMLADPL